MSNHEKGKSLTEEAANAARRASRNAIQTLFDAITLEPVWHYWAESADAANQPFQRLFAQTLENHRLVRLAVLTGSAYALLGFCELIS